MNDKTNTFLGSGKGTLSALDLSFCHPSLYLDFDWSVCEDQHGSDHFILKGYLEQKHIGPSNLQNVNHGELMFQI